MNWKERSSLNGHLAAPFAPQPTVPAERAFPGASVAERLYPPICALPAEPHQGWLTVVRWIITHGGAGKLGMIPRAGIDPEVAFNHLTCVLGTFATAHEYKMESAAFLLDQWFSEALQDYKGAPGEYRSLLSGDMVQVVNPNE